MEKQKNGQFVRETPETKNKKRNMELAKWEVETEAMLCATEQQAIQNRQTAQSPLCRMCDKKSEAISQIVNECEMLAQKKYKRRHNNVA